MSQTNDLIERHANKKRDDFLEGVANRFRLEGPLKKHLWFLYKNCESKFSQEKMRSILDKELDLISGGKDEDIGINNAIVCVVWSFIQDPPRVIFQNGRYMRYEDSWKTPECEQKKREDLQAIGALEGYGKQKVTLVPGQGPLINEHVEIDDHGRTPWEREFHRIKNLPPDIATEHRCQCCAGNGLVTDHSKPIPVGAGDWVYPMTRCPECDGNGKFIVRSPRGQ